MDEYEKRYYKAAWEFTNLVVDFNNGDKPKSISEEIVGSIFLRKNSYDLLTFAFFKLSRFECLTTYETFYNSIFTSRNPNNNLFFVYCFLKHINYVFGEEVGKLNTPGLIEPWDDVDAVYSKISEKNGRSLSTIFKSNYLPVLNYAAEYIKVMEEESKLEIIEYFRYLIFEYGFNCVLYLADLDELGLFFFCLDVDRTYDSLVREKVPRGDSPVENSAALTKKIITYFMI